MTLKLAADRRPTVLIALNLSANKRGGTEVYLEHLAHEASSQGARPVVAVASVTAEVRDRLERNGAEVRVFGEVTEAVAARRLARIALEVRARAALLHFFRLLTPVAPALALTGARVIYVDDHSGGGTRRAPLAEVAAFAAHRALARVVFRFIAVSDFVRARLLTAGHMKHHEVVRVYNGVRPCRRVSAEDRAALRRRLGIDDQRLFLFAAGNLISDKGFHVMIEALDRGSPWSVRIAGEGAERERLLALARTRGADVELLGRRSDVPELMASADVVAVPSVWKEAFGFTVAEAMRAGAPVIASNIGGIPELIRHRETGLLVTPGSQPSFAHALATLANDEELRARLGKAAAVDAEQRFNVERMARDMFENLKEAIHAHPARGRDSNPRLNPVAA